jgi:hypothetical protein
LDDKTNETKSRTEPKKKREETNHLLQEHDVPWDNILLAEGVFSFSEAKRLGSLFGKTGFGVGLEFLGEGLCAHSMVSPGTNSFGT